MMAVSIVGSVWRSVAVVVCAHSSHLATSVYSCPCERACPDCVESTRASAATQCELRAFARPLANQISSHNPRQLCTQLVRNESHKTKLESLRRALQLRLMSSSLLTCCSSGTSRCFVSTRTQTLPAAAHSPNRAAVSFMRATKTNATRASSFPGRRRLNAHSCDSVSGALGRWPTASASEYFAGGASLPLTNFVADSARRSCT